LAAITVGLAGTPGVNLLDGLASRSGG
jgi:hypothetical protein